MQNVQSPRMKVISQNELEVFLGICMYMSIVDTSFRRSYWSLNTRQDMVADAMTINRLEEILSALHLNDPALENKSSEGGFDPSPEDSSHGGETPCDIQ